jgi:type I restriction enzyme M protein
VLFFGKKRVSAEPNTKELRIYDLRTNQRFTLKERPISHADLDDFVACYKSGRERARDKVNLDILWLKDDTLDDPDLLPPLDEIAAEIVENLEAALDRFRKVALSLQAG